jgi:hypothetical protein
LPIAEYSQWLQDVIGCLEGGEPVPSIMYTSTTLPPLNLLASSTAPVVRLEVHASDVEEELYIDSETSSEE